MNKQIPSYYRRTLADGTVEMFPAGPSGAMPVFPGTAQNYTIEPITGYVPYYYEGAHKVVLYLPAFGATGAAA